MKKIVTLLCALIMSIALFTGCNVIQRDDAKYYQKVVATIGEKEFTMQDLLQAYSSYGSSYVEEQNYTVEEAVKQTVNDMIDRYLLVEELVNTGLVDIDQYEEDLKRSVYEYMDSQIDDYETEVRLDWGLNVSTPEQEEESDTLSKYERVAREKYESNYEAHEESGKWYISYKPTEIECDTTPAPETWEQKITDSKVSAEARKRMLADLKQSAKALGETDLSEETLLKNEMDRVYEIYRQNKVISVYQTTYLNQLEVDDEAVVEKYKSLFALDYEKYKQLGQSGTSEADATRLSAYHTAMGEDAGSTYYHVEDTYVEVAHILLKVDDTTTQLLAEYKARYESENNTEYSKEQYEKDCQDAINKNLQTIYYLDENGKECQSSLSSVLSMIYDYVDNGSNTGYSRSDRFLDMMYRFNDDEGIMNADCGYAIPMYTNDEVQDTMVAAFADGSRELAEAQPEGGNMKTVYSEYGIHIIYNMGLFSNDGRTIENINNITAKYLWEHRVSPMNEKTLFDAVAETLTQASADTALSNLIDQAKIKLQNAGIKINLYTSRYEHLWK